MDDDYKRFCLKCSWNDSDFGCTSPRGEEVWQCPLYIHYHPEEVKEFEQSMEEWVRRVKQMTNEMTAKEAVKQIKENCYFASISEKTKQALDMAIKALEQQPCKDCVSRADVKEQMLKYGFNAPDMTVTEFVEDCLQPVTPQPKKGEWIVFRCGDTDTFKCSECGMRVINPYKYCPNCGAEMSGGGR